MSIDNHTIVIYGWKVEGKDKSSEFENACEEVDKDFWDKFLDEIFISDSMCGNYSYFGAILVDYDAEYGYEGEIVIDDALVKKCTAKYNKFIAENPELAKVFDKYKDGEPKLYVFQHIW